MKNITLTRGAGTGPRATQEHYRARRARFIARMAPKSVAIIVSNPERTRSNDTEFRYRQSSDLLYLAGFPEPESVLVLTNIEGEPSFQMLVRPKDRQSEIWTGIRQGVEGARANYGAEAAFTVDKFAEVIGRLLSRADRVYYKTGHNEHFDGEFNKVWTARQRTLDNPEDIVHEMRLFKTAEELDLMREAARISAEAHKLAMRSSSPGLFEYQLEALIEGKFRWEGADAPAYGTIVGGGNNAVVLHYVENAAALRDGDLVLIDAGCEYQGYAADITRTFPVNGRFSDAQREIYELVLKAQLAAIKAAQPGATLASVHATAQRVLRTGLVQLGILAKGARTKKSKSRKSSGKAALTLADFYMHGTSHWLGIDVHDKGSYNADGKSTDRRGARTRVLEPGMVITVEPGLYFDRDDKRVPARYRGIGVRIEDDVVITASGHEVITAAAPKTVADIEALMAGGKAQDAPAGCAGDDDIWIGER